MSQTPCHITCLGESHSWTAHTHVFANTTLFHIVMSPFFVLICCIILYFSYYVNRFYKLFCNDSEPCKFPGSWTSYLHERTGFRKFIGRSNHMSKRKASQMRFCEWGSELLQLFYLKKIAILPGKYGHLPKYLFGCLINSFQRALQRMPVDDYIPDKPPVLRFQQRRVRSCGTPTLSRRFS